MQGRFVWPLMWRRTPKVLSPNPKASRRNRGIATGAAAAKLSSLAHADLVREQPFSGDEHSPSRKSASSRPELLGLSSRERG
jgi:hypothetical protein